MYNQIKSLMEQEEYVQAKELIDTQKQTSAYTDTLAILEATIYYNQNKLPEMFSCIREGLLYNCKNYELYFMLGEYYLNTNPKQAYICFEQAEFYCSDDNDLLCIQQAKDSLSTAGYAVPKLSIVVLSYNAKEEMALCLDSLKETTSDKFCELIIIDNASTDGVTDYLKEQIDIKLICNETNLGFPAGCNLGIKVSEPYNDIFLLNNDTVVPPNAIFWLRMGLYENDSVGATGSVSNHVSNNQKVAETFASPAEYFEFAKTNNLPMEFPYEKKLRLVGFAFMIKRTVLDSIGLLDERFTPGNLEDDDLSLRILQAGYQLLVCKNSFIYHFGSRGFGKDMDAYLKLSHRNAAKFYLKWGFEVQYYNHERANLVSIMEDSLSDETFKVLEVGCGMGSTLGYILNRHPKANVYGVELNDSVVSLAKNFIPTIECGNIETTPLSYPENYFDYIICADVLEHLHDPQNVLKTLHKYLKSGGRIIASIPNLMHYTVILDLLKGNFTYQDAGLLDKTHIHMFTWNEIVKMFLACGYQMDCINYTKQPNNNMSLEDKNMYDSLLQIPGIAEEIQFNAYQYLISAKKV